MFNGNKNNKEEAKFGGGEGEKNIKIAKKTKL